MKRRFPLNSKVKGFTLMEILIAIFIVAIIAIIMIRGLQTVVSAKDNISRNADRLANVTLAMSLLQSDLQNVTNRPIADVSGVSKPPLQLNDDAWQTLDLTRAGVANPLAQQRSSLMRIGYQVQNGDLVRLTWPVLDPVTTTRASKRILLKNITHWQWQFLGADNRFYMSWPATNAANQPLPKAIKITLNIRNWGTISRLFVVQNHVVAQNIKKPT